MALAEDCGVSDRAVRAWRRDEYPPDDIETLERVLFGANDAYAEWKSGLRDAWSRAKRQREVSVAADPTPPARIESPDLCLGRDDDAALLLAALRGPQDVIAIVLGQAGIGKTTLTRQVAASPDLAARFGDRRWFVALETAFDRAGLRERIVVAVGGNPAEPARLRPCLPHPGRGRRAPGARQPGDPLGSRPARRSKYVDRHLDADRFDGDHYRTQIDARWRAGDEPDKTSSRLAVGVSCR